MKHEEAASSGSEARRGGGEIETAWLRKAAVENLETENRSQYSHGF